MESIKNLKVNGIKVGDNVYEFRPERNFISKYKVISIEIFTDMVLYHWELVEGAYSSLKGFSASVLGESVFKSEIEAMRAYLEAGNHCPHIETDKNGDICHASDGETCFENGGYKCTAKLDIHGDDLR
ncbi:hypothetical protein M2146_002532 [Lachnospiraceae bacterium PF1-22]